MKLKKALCGLSAAALMLSSMTAAAGAEELRTAVVEKIYAANTFEQDGITYVELSDGTLEIRSVSLDITDLAIPETVNGKKVTSISYMDMRNIKSLHIPGSINNFAGGIQSEGYYFSAPDLTSITVDPDNPYFYVKNNALCGTDDGENVLYCYCGGLTEKSYSIPDGITFITLGAFSGSSIETLNIPASLTHISLASASEYYPELFLIGMNKLKQINVDPANKVFYSADGVLYQLWKYTDDRTVDMLFKYPNERPRDTLVIPDGVESIINLQGDFNSLYIPASVTDFTSDFTAKDLYFSGTEAQFREKTLYIDFEECYLSDYCKDNNITVHCSASAPSASPSTSAKPANAGYDINGDNAVNIADVMALLGKVVGGDTSPAYDVNGDGSVNIADVLQLLRTVVNG